MRGRIYTKKTTIDDIVFDSEMEGDRYIELKELLNQGVISDLVLQPEYPLTGEVVKIDPYNGKEKVFSPMKYVADFRYMKDGVEIIEDVKGFMMTEFIIKQKLFESLYPDKTITLIVFATKALGFMEYNDNVDRKKQNKTDKRMKEREAQKKVTYINNLQKKRARLVDRANDIIDLDNPTRAQQNRLEQINSILIPEIDKELLGKSK